MTTNSNYYAIYIDKVLQLARTIVVKSEATADTINRYIRLVYGEDRVDDSNPASWKYYCHMSGTYHFTDEVMTVTSMDNLEEIVFSKENLAIHRATARGYAYGTRQYEELVSRFPQQELLIRGILYPVDVNVAIAAPDGKILGYKPDLVESNEYTLIARLQKWIDGYRLRWMNKVNMQYAISDNLFLPTMLGIMYVQMVPAILNLRLESCRTNEAHSFHVRQYLGSHGFLDSYMDQLSTKQALFFYRNINYIERNAGAQHVYEWLVEHIMTERNLPLASYSMGHDLSKQPTEISPTLVFERTPENLGYSLDSNDTIDLEQILRKEDGLARDNVKYREDVKPEIQAMMEDSLANALPTKALESSMVDYTDATPYTMSDILLNHWLYLSHRGYYNAFVGITNPKTGERIPLSMKDAFCFMWYAFCASWGCKLDLIPKVFAKRVQRIPMATPDDLVKVVNPKYIKRELAVQALSYQPVIEPVISIEAFYRVCQEIHTAANLQRGLCALQEHKDRRGYAQNMVSQIYSDNVIQLAEAGENYTAWLSARNIAVGDFTENDFGLLYLDIVREATGLSLTTTSSLRDLQRAMVKMLGQLSSYSIQFMSEINDSAIQMSDNPAIRVGDVDGTASGEFWIDHPTLGVQHAYGTGSQYVLAPMPETLIREDFGSSMSASFKLELPDLVSRPPLGDEYLYRLETGNVRASQTTTGQQNRDGIIPVLGIEEYLQLSPEQRTQFKDVYGTCWWPVVINPGDRPLSEAIPNQILDGLHYDNTADLSAVDPDLSGFDPAA